MNMGIPDLHRSLWKIIESVQNYVCRYPLQKCSACYRSRRWIYQVRRRFGFTCEDLSVTWGMMNFVPYFDLLCNQCFRNSNIFQQLGWPCLPTHSPHMHWYTQRTTHFSNLKPSFVLCWLTHTFLGEWMSTVCPATSDLSLILFILYSL